MIGEIDKITKQNLSQLSNRAEHYKHANANSSKAYPGIVSFNNTLNNLTARYNVIVPSLNNATLTNVPIKTSFVGANGVGYRPPALRPGQPVTIRFTSDSNALPYIDGSFFVIGSEEQYRSKPPGVDDKHSDNGQAINPPPISPEFIQVAGQASLEVHPMILRSSSPVHGSGSPAGLEVPGVSILKDSFGNLIQMVPGQETNVRTKSKIDQTIGADGSIANEVMKKAVETSLNTLRQFLESDPKFASISRGVYSLGRLHPKSKQSQQIISSGTSTSSSSVEASLELATQYLDILDNTLSLYVKQVALAIQQIRHVLTTTYSYYTQLKAIWGQLGIVGNILSGKEFVPSNSIEEILGFSPPELTNTLKELYLKFSTIVGLGLRLSAAPTSIKTEGRLLFGGVNFSDKPKKLEYKPVLRIVTQEYKYNYQDNPSYELAVFLNSFGIVRAGAITQKTIDFTVDPNTSTFLAVADEFITPDLQLLNSLVRQVIGLPFFIESEPIYDYLDYFESLYPASNSTALGCPVLDTEVYTVFPNVQVGDFDSQSLKSFVSDYLLKTEPVNFKNFLYDPGQALDLYPQESQQVLRPLLQGNLGQYYVNVLKNQAIVSLEDYPLKQEELNFYISKAHQLGVNLESIAG